MMMHGLTNVKYREVYPTDAALLSSLVHWWSAHVESRVNMKTA